MRFIRQNLAVALAVLLMLPARPVLADNNLVSENIAAESAKAETTETEDKSQTIAETAATIAETVAETVVETAEIVEETAAAETTEEETADTEEAEEIEEAEETETTAAEIAETIAETVAAIAETWKAETETDDSTRETDDSISDGKIEDWDNYAIATPNNAVKHKVAEAAGDEVKFNTGNHVWRVVSYEDFWENEIGDGCFEEDGSYTIHIPEENPFFPYEVQFIYKGKTINEWFMTPDDSVEVGGHTFYVSAHFDDSVVTQMSLKVAGETVVVYPEEKRFTDDGDGTAALSLLPLEERKLTVDLKGYTPIELSMVSISSLFSGNIQSTDKVLWKYRDEEDYQVGVSDGVIDLSRDTHKKDTVVWQMIVGDDDQLASGNIRYFVTVNVTKCNNWLIPTVYTQDQAGNRKKVKIGKSEYTTSDAYILSHGLDIYAQGMEAGTEYLGLKVNTDVFSNTHYDKLKVYNGTQIYNAELAYQFEQEGGNSFYDFTEQVFAEDMTEMNAGISPGFTISMAAFDSSGEVIGFQLVNILIWQEGGVYPSGFYVNNGNTRTSLELIEQISTKDEWDYEWFIYEENTEEAGYMVFTYKENGIEDISAVTAAYAGQYSSIKEAEAAGAENIKDILFDQSDKGGYKADFSNGVNFSVFIGNDSSDQIDYHLGVRTETKVSKDSLLSFTGLKDKDGKFVNCYVVDSEEDYYAEYSYITILAEEGTDLLSLAPVFQSQKGTRVYTSGSSSSEKSGESYHDFSDGAVQYMVSDEKGEISKNYWLQVVTPVKGQGKLYINSLAAKEAETKTGADGSITSIREMFINYNYDNQHDILLMNIGTEPIANLKVEVDSQQVKLDSYWTLNGDYELAGASTVSRKEGVEYGQLPNMAKVRLLKKNVIGSEEISGTLTLKSGNKVLMVLTLTGMIGSPEITDWKISDGVKYVPYGTMISNNNKYSWNEVTYRLTGGKLPKGMTLKPNGELYGVPTESGEFGFSVSMENSYSGFASCESYLTLTITENTDANVDAATDKGYELTQRVPDITMSAVGDYTMVSNGDYEEFVDVFLDGEKLVKGTDYTSEAGSTRITIRSQTLKRSNKTGVHTLGIEFRMKGTKILKRAAQNFRIKDTGSSGSSGSGSGSSGGGGSSGSIRRSSASWIYKDPKKGYVHMITGIITDSKSGYSHWQQDETGWKLIYADGTPASGYMTELKKGEHAEQVIWEKVNGSWYAFGADGYLKSGWVYDYRLGRWYVLSVDTGMLNGWYKDPVDNHTYYLDPSEGGMSTGWREIDRKWYYFNTTVTEPSWEFNKETKKWQYNTKSKSKPYGAMLRNEKTPDGYRVNADGTWDGEEKQ